MPILHCNFAEDTFVDDQMAEVQEGYKAVQYEISERLEDLELMLQFLERCGGIFGLQDWANETETKLHQLKPTSRNVEELERQIEAFKVWRLWRESGKEEIGKERYLLLHFYTPQLFC